MAALSGQVRFALYWLTQSSRSLESKSAKKGSTRSTTSASSETDSQWSASSKPSTKAWTVSGFESMKLGIAANEL